MLKKSLLFLLVLSLLSGCTTRAYESNMELGRSELKEEHYLEASEAFDKAYQDKETAEAKDLLKLSSFMSKAMTAYETTDYPTALSYLKKVTDYKTREPEGKVIREKAKELTTEVGLTVKENEEMIFKLAEGKLLLAQNQAEAAVVLFQEVADSNLPKSSKHKSEAKSLIERNSETSTDKKSEDISESVKNKNVRNPEKTKEKNAVKDPESSSDEQESLENKTLTHNEAKALVVEFIDMAESSNLTLQFDREDEAGNYIFQVYEIVIDNPETKEGHTATWGWYSVNPKTKEVVDLM